MKSKKLFVFVILYFLVDCKVTRFVTYKRKLFVKFFLEYFMIIRSLKDTQKYNNYNSSQLLDLILWIFRIFKTYFAG